MQSSQHWWAFVRPLLANIAPVLRAAPGSLLLLGAAACAGSSREVASAEAERPATPTTVAAASSQPTASETSSAAPDSTAARLDIPPYGASADRIMRAHFNDALLIRQAVIDGRPEEAANPATVIAVVQDLEKVPEGWRPFVLDMQRTARRISEGSTPAVVAAAAADLGLTCGACHAQFGGPKASSAPAPPKGDTVQSRMAHHAWATERLWEGLAVPSDAAWTTGAAALSVEPFPRRVLDEGGVDARSAASDFTKLVARAASSSTPPERAALYAELLLTCGTCHRAVSDAH